MQKKEKRDLDLLMALLRGVHNMGADRTSISPEDLERQRKSQDLFASMGRQVLGVHTREVFAKRVDGPGEVHCEWTATVHSGAERMILYLHGGGYTCGTMKYVRVLASKMAKLMQAYVFSPEYRLAPEHPYPAALQDARSAWEYLIAQNIAPEQILLAGDSAGGNLALELVLQLRREGKTLPGGLFLMSPWTDMTAGGKSYEKYKDKDPLLTREYIYAVREAYRGNREGVHGDCWNGEKEELSFADEAFSPLFADFTGFPRTLIQVGSHEILRSDSEELAERMRKAGCRVRLEVYRKSWHVFQQMPLRRAVRALERAGEFFYEAKK